MDEYITLDYGSGGRKTASLIQEILLPAFGNPALNALGDGAVIPGGEEMVFSTDSFVVSPLFFPGGDIGKLAVCGTLNDIAMAGGQPLYLSFSLIIEEGFPSDQLRRIVDSAAKEARKAGICIVTGDTKVVEKGCCDGLFINTAGIGLLKTASLGRQNLREGDKILVSGPVGDHGLTVLLARHPDLLSGDLRSDCANIAPLAQALFSLGSDLKLLRDPTRGGAATALSELAAGTPYSFELKENLLPISPSTRSACRLLGLDPLYSANEGKLLAVVSAEKAPEALALLQAFPEGKEAAIIGEVTALQPGRCLLRTFLGAIRVLQPLSGTQFPRIC